MSQLYAVFISEKWLKRTATPPDVGYTRPCKMGVSSMVFVSIHTPTGTQLPPAVFAPFRLFSEPWLFQLFFHL